MRKIILGSVIIIVVLFISFLIIGMGKKVQNRKLITEKIARLPSFSFMKLSNESFNSSEIKKGPVLIVHFHPECEHCKYEISEILKSDIPASGTSVIMVSSADPYELRKFFSQFDYSDYPAINVLVDSSYIFGNIFGSDVVPSNYIYNKDLNLVKVLYGEVKTETILKYLHDSE